MKKRARYDPNWQANQEVGSTAYSPYLGNSSITYVNTFSPNSGPLHRVIIPSEKEIACWTGEAESRDFPFLAWKTYDLGVSKSGPYIKSRRGLASPLRITHCMKAQCDISPTSEHASPHPQCTCGFYGWKLPAEELKEKTDTTPGTIVTEVELFGTVLEAEYGYRAQYQKILRADVIMPPICDRWLCRTSVSYIALEESTGTPSYYCRLHGKCNDLCASAEDLTIYWGYPVAFV